MHTSLPLACVCGLGIVPGEVAKVPWVSFTLHAFLSDATADKNKEVEMQPLAYIISPHTYVHARVCLVPSFILYNSSSQEKIKHTIFSCIYTKAAPLFVRCVYHLESLCFPFHLIICGLIRAERGTCWEKQHFLGLGGVSHDWLRHVSWELCAYVWISAGVCVGIECCSVCNNRIDEKCFLI